MSLHIFAANERRAVSNAMKAAVFMFAFFIASLLSGGQALASTSIPGGEVAHRAQEQIVFKAVSVGLKGVRLNVQHGTCVIEAFNSPQLVSNWIVLNNNCNDIDSHLAVNATSNKLILSLANLADDKLYGLQTNIQISAVGNKGRWRAGLTQVPANISLIRSMPYLVEGGDLSQRLSLVGRVLPNQQSEEASRAVLLSRPQNLVWGSRLILL